MQLGEGEDWNPLIRGGKKQSLGVWLPPQRNLSILASGRRETAAISGPNQTAGNLLLSQASPVSYGSNFKGWQRDHIAVCLTSRGSFDIDSV